MNNKRWEHLKTEKENWNLISTIFKTREFNIFQYTNREWIKKKEFLHFYNFFKGSFNRYITHLGGGGIDFCFGVLWNCVKGQGGSKK